MPGIAALIAALISHPLILGADPVPLGAQAPLDQNVAGSADRHERMTVPVAVEGNGPYRFLIDTGSQRTVVSTALAATLKLPSGPEVQVMGIAGTNRVATAEVEELTFGKRLVTGLTVPLLEDRHIGADGIIGTDSLQHDRVLLDFTRNTMTIGEAKALGGRKGFEIVVTARRRDGRLILTNAVIDGISVDVVIDTGASATIGNRALQRAMRERGESKGTIDSVTGQSIIAEIGTADKLSLGKLGIANVLIAYADAPAFGELKLEKRPAIFLGMREMRAFKRIAIDFPTRKILFDLPE